ncbi:hypothetical protein ENBRE01_2266, partial [Enteropsectra breve]
HDIYKMIDNEIAEQKEHALILKEDLDLFIEQTEVKFGEIVKKHMTEYCSLCARIDDYNEIIKSSMNPAVKAIELNIRKQRNVLEDINNKIIKTKIEKLESINNEKSILIKFLVNMLTCCESTTACKYIDAFKNSVYKAINDLEAMSDEIKTVSEKLKIFNEDIYTTLFELENETESMQNSNEFNRIFEEAMNKVKQAVDKYKETEMRFKKVEDFGINTFINLRATIIPESDFYKNDLSRIIKSLKNTKDEYLKLYDEVMKIKIIRFYIVDFQSDASRSLKLYKAGKM